MEPATGTVGWLPQTSSANQAPWQRQAFLEAGVGSVLGPSLPHLQVGANLSLDLGESEGILMVLYGSLLG